MKYLKLIIEYAKYIKWCFNVGGFRSFRSYRNYVRTRDWVLEGINYYRDLLPEKLNALNRFRSMVNNHIYVCGHSMPETGMILAIQVSAFYRAHHGINRVDSTCRTITALYREIVLTEEERVKFFEFIRLDNWLRSVDRNHTVQMNILYNQFKDILRDRARLHDFSHDINLFFIVEIYEDGTIRYRYNF